MKEDKMANQESSADTLYGPLAPDRTALLVIDMQRYFVRPEYTYGKNAMKDDSKRASAYFQRVLEIVIPNIRRLLEKCRVLGVYCVY
jgi:nicotinamidase-related amidase